MPPELRSPNVSSLKSRSISTSLPSMSNAGLQLNMTSSTSPLSAARRAMAGLCVLMPMWPITPRSLSSRAYARQLSCDAMTTS